MQLYRLLLNHDFSLLVRAPTKDLLQLYVENVGDEGYHLIEILILLYPGTLKTVKIIDLGEIGPNETILDWSVINL